MDTGELILEVSIQMDWYLIQGGGEGLVTLLVA